MNPSEAEALQHELAEIAAALRAALEWQQASGATGLPRDFDARDKAKAALLQADAPNELPLPPGPPAIVQHPPGPRARALGSPSPSPSRPNASSRGDAPAEPVHLREAAAQALRSGADQTAPSPQQHVESSPHFEPPRPAPAGPARVNLRPIASDLPDNLLELEEVVRSCQRCELSQTRQKTVFARGSRRSGLCFVGEGPGADEDATGEPFVGKAGQLLDKMIAAMGFERDDVYIMNIVKCRPPDNRKPERQEIAACSGLLHRQLELLDPEIIVALGATAVEGLLGDAASITRIRGRFRLYRGQIALMPTFHPAYLLRNPNAKREVWNDLRQVVHHMGRTLPGESPPAQPD